MTSGVHHMDIDKTHEVGLMVVSHDIVLDCSNFDFAVLYGVRMIQLQLKETTCHKI